MSEKFQVVTLEGCLVPFCNGKALTLKVPGSDRFYLPVFSGEKTLKSLEGAYDQTISIEDVDTFLTQLNPEVVVAYDPHLEGGCFRCLEIQRTNVET